MELCSLPAIYLGPNYGGGNEDDGDVKWESRRVEETNRFSEYYNQYNKCKIKELGWYWYEEKLAQAQRKQAGLLKRWQHWVGSQRLSACQAGRAWCEGCGFPAEERRYAKRDAMADSTLCLEPVRPAPPWPWQAKSLSIVLCSPLASLLHQPTPCHFFYFILFLNFT